ncbi:DUF7848 domain-containing protein [Streptomyces jumonjinensis]|uniref:DUF7848 domain-containing protein n=1 Tax=Streptomyces jumonjinensis TaxID=1945 RepID=UPI0037B15D7C
MTRATYRFRNYEISSDPTSPPPAYSAVCVTGEESDCGAATSDEQITEDAVAEWIAEHSRDTGHDLYRKKVEGYVRSEPGEWQ